MTGEKISVPEWDRLNLERFEDIPALISQRTHAHEGALLPMIEAVHNTNVMRRPLYDPTEIRFAAPSNYLHKRLDVTRAGKMVLVANWLTSDPALCQTFATWQVYAMYKHSFHRLRAQPFGQLFFLVNAGKLEAGL